jgi:hypothetical protein
MDQNRAGRWGSILASAQWHRCTGISGDNLGGFRVLCDSRFIFRNLGQPRDAEKKTKGKSLGCAMLAFAYYNFCQIQKTLRVTPAMQAGIADRV